MEMSQLQTIGILSILTCLSLYYSYKESTKNNKFVCDSTKKYLKATYMYLITAMLLYFTLLAIGLVIINIESYMNFTKSMGHIGFMIFLIVLALAIYVLMRYMNTIVHSNISLAHFIWMLIIGIFTFLTVPLYLSYFSINLTKINLLQDILLAILIFASLSIFVYMNPDKVNEVLLGKILKYATFAVVFLLLLFPYFTSQMSNVNKRLDTYMIITIITFGLFCLWTVYHTKKTYLKSKECHEKKENPNYLHSSMRFFMDLSSILEDVMRMRMIRAMRRRR